MFKNNKYIETGKMYNVVILMSFLLTLSILAKLL